MKKKESGISKRKLRSSYLTSIISISLVLFLLGLIGILLLNAKKISDHVKENIGFSIFLKDNIREVDIIRLQKRLDAMPFVKSTDYITKEEAAADFQEELGEDFIDFLGYNPLGASIEVRFIASFAHPDSISGVENEISKYEEVHEIFYQKSLVHLVHENVRKISLILLAFSVLMFLVAVALINNTIRLSVYSKRFLIKTMQLVGATRSFIRRPFLGKSATHGVYAAFLAIALLVGIIYLAQKELVQIISFQDVEIIGILFLAVIILGIVINWISTFFAVNRFLRMRSDDLYY
ncbi:MAG: cell division protein FtsX [Bacteroidales bacterium]|nr:cell division protein FtsX [Bacteroidales bacterium]